MFRVDPGWHEAYWRTEEPLFRRPAIITAVARLIVAGAVLGGGAVLLGHFHVRDPSQGYQQWVRD